MTTASQETRAARAQAELSLLVDMVPSHLWQLAPDGEPIARTRLHEAPEALKFDFDHFAG